MKAFLLSLEALAAIGILILIAVFLSGITLNTSPELRYERLYVTAKDVLNILENARISETKGIETLDGYIEQGIIVDTEATLLDAIGFLWSSGNVSLASPLAQEILEKILNGTGYNYQLIMGNTVIYEKNTTSASFVARLSTVASGYDIGKPVSGFVSRAYITQPSKQDTVYGFFGGYVGDGNLSKMIELPNLDSVLSAELEMDAGNNFTLYINGNYSGVYSKAAKGNFSSDKWSVPSQYLGYFTQGRNMVGINFTKVVNNYIGGGHIKVRFNTTELVFSTQAYLGSNASGNYSFPGIRGIINLFDSFYVPGNITNLSAYLEYRSDYKVFLSIGNVTVFTGSNTTQQSLTIPDSNLSSLLNYSGLGASTIPIRFGTENITGIGGIGALDASLITDRSGSMTECDVAAACNSSNLCDTSGPCYANRHLVALQADREFVDVITSTPGNNVGLIGFGGMTCGITEVISDNATLQANINDYNYNNIWQSCGWTCISCSVESATVQLTEFESLWGLKKISALNTTPIHVGDTGPVAVNVTFNMGLNTSNFVKGRIIVLGTNTDVASGYQDCVFLNGNYMGRICESDSASLDSWHTCMYPFKKEWINAGQNIITITGANTLGCFDTAGDQDDWDFKSVEMSVWETNSQPPGTSRVFDPSVYELNSQPTINYSIFANLWELTSDLPYPVDFTSGYNTTANTFGLAGNDDGWDWDTQNGSGPYGYDDDADYNGAVNGKLEFDFETGVGFNNCNSRDCSGAYGIEVNITPEIYSQVLAGEQVFVSFEYEWDGNDDPFEGGDQVWVKGIWTSPSTGGHWLGSSLDSGHSGADPDLEIATQDNPDTDFSGFFYQNITPWVEGAGSYYLDFGGKLLASSTDEWGYFRFDDVALGVYSGTLPGIGNEFNLSFTVSNVAGIKSASIDFEAQDVSLGFYDCLFLNNNMVGRMDEQKWNGSLASQKILFDLPVAWLQQGQNNITFTGGTTLGCKRVGSNDNWAFRRTNISFVVSNESDEYGRTKAMLIMSDGAANTRIGDCINYGSAGCPSTGGETPPNETIRKACDAHNKYGIRIYSVAFGNESQAATDTLNQSAGCDSYDNFYTSNEKDELINIYRTIAQGLVNISFQAQTVNFTGNVSLNNSLSPKSYIRYDYISTIPPLQFGEVTFNFESLPLRNSTGGSIITDNVTGTKEGWFLIPPETRVIDARVTSYSSEFWTDRLYVKGNQTNFTRVYWLEDFGAVYSGLGDPYNVYIPTDLLSPGGNHTVRLGTGLAPGNATGGSPDSKVIYTLRISGLNLEGYSGVFPKARGSRVTVYYDVNGDNVFDSSALVAYGSSPSDGFDPQNDSVDDAFMRLLDNLNLIFDANPGDYGSGSVADPYDGVNQTNPVDIQLSEIFFDSSSITGITSLWGPTTLTINVWI